MSSLTDNAAQHRLEMTIDGKLVFANYQRRDHVLVIPHVEADPALRGSGAAGRFMEELMRYVEQEGLKILPLCGYAATWMHRHAEHHGLLAES